MPRCHSCLLLTSSALCCPPLRLQWHPEKPPFEFSDTTIPHTHDAISVSQHMANMFVDHARQSAHVPVSKEEELAMLVYNYRAVFTARDIVMEPSYDGCARLFWLSSCMPKPFHAQPLVSSIHPCPVTEESSAALCPCFPCVPTCACQPQLRSTCLA
jgi:hypothetical protein